jgi:PAS domain S-box-containing protein
MLKKMRKVKRRNTTNNLRTRAENLLRENTLNTEAHASVNTNTLMHELQLSQIELEMQNEELRTAYSALEESHSRYVDLFDFAPLGYFQLSRESVIDDVNLAGAQLLGLERRYLINRKFYRFISADCRDEFYNYCHTIFKTAKQQTCELKLIKKDNTQLFVELTGIVVLHTTENYGQLRIAISDITLRRKAEMRARQHELELAHFARLTALGEMVLSIAHEINQPLTAIVQYIGGCIMRLQDLEIDPTILDIMRRVMLQAEHAGAIIHRVKAFLKKESVETTDLNINKAIRSVITLIEHEIKNARVNMHLKLADSLPSIKGDYIQLQQVILNIMQNAIEAMFAVSSPQLTIQTQYTLEDKIEIIISDNGEGIPLPIIDKIFNPFFTTKAKGIGIGLSIVRSIIEQQDGYIAVVSNIKQGTQFHLLFPVFKKEVDTVCSNQ